MRQYHYTPLFGVVLNEMGHVNHGNCRCREHARDGEASLDEFKDFSEV